jgi:hypothetical protein
MTTRPPPFFNLFDVAGILMTTTPLVLLFVIAGGIPAKILCLFVGLFFAALFFARKGTPE